MAKFLINLVSTAEALKEDTENKLKLILRDLQDSAAFQGHIRTYEPYFLDPNDASASDELKEALARKNAQPEERVNVRRDVAPLLQQMVELQSKVLNTLYQIDVGNQKAKADLVVAGDRVIKKDVPATTLMVLRKLLKRTREIVAAVPVPDPAIEWRFDKALNRLVSVREVVAQKTAKTPQVITKAPATEKHPAQTELLYIDKPVGEYRMKKFSGSMSASVKEQMLSVIDNAITCVKDALQTANISVRVEADEIASELFKFLMEPLNNADTVTTAQS